MPLRILVGFDGSAAAQHALDFALAMARGMDGEVRVIYAAPLPVGSPEAAASLMADPAALHPGLSAQVAAQAASAGVGATFAVTPGTPGDVLLREIRAGHADHLVIGSTGRGALARWLLGSVAGEVTLHNLVPVTVVP